MGLALELAKRTNALDADGFPPEAWNWAKVAITDLVGCCLAGAEENAARLVLASLGSGDAEGPCTFLGRSQRLRPLDAALVNGTAGHALDFDDTSKSMAGHPTVVIVPALFALGEELDVSGRQLVAAYVVGLEVATRFARGVNFHHYEKGWHPTATLGIFGAAAACGRLLGLDDDRLAAALAISASLAAGVKSNFGTETKPLHAGAAARNGLHAARLAQAGFSAAADAFEHAQGFLEVFNGPGRYDVPRMLGGWGEPLDLLDPGISIKKYPCVYSIHAAVDAAILLHGEDAVPAADIRSVLVTMHRRRLLSHVQRAADSALDAKFSLRYAVALALLSGAVRLEDFEGEAFRDPAVRELMARISTAAHDDDANDYGAELQVRLSDGSVRRRVVRAPLGQGPATPLPQAMLRAKFLDCAKRALPARRSEELFDALQDLDARPSLRAVLGGAVPIR